jgi:hypothetical protein
MGMLFLESEIFGIELLVDWRVDDLRVELLLVLMFVMDSPIDGLLASRGEADAVDIQRIQFRILLW